MIQIIKVKASEDIIKNIAEDFDGYIKVVVDVERRILAVGGTKHVDGEQLLLENGSTQQDLWGGGFDLETDEIDFDSMINLRPGDNNPSREVLSQEIRKRMVEIIRQLLR